MLDEESIKTNPLGAFMESQKAFMKTTPNEAVTSVTSEAAPAEGNVAEEETPETTTENNQPDMTEVETPPEEKKDTETPEVVEAKRYKDAQRKITEMAEANKAYRKLVEPFENLIQYDDKGHPKGIDFSKIPNNQPPPPPPVEIQEPTQQEWEDSQFDAKKMRDLTKRQNAFDINQDFKKRQAEWNKKQQEKQVQEAQIRQKQEAKVFDEAQAKSYTAACAEFEGYGLKGHPLRLKAESIVKEQPHLVHLPNADWIIASLAALEMGIQKKTPAPKPLPQKSTMMNLGKTGNSSKVQQQNNPHLQRFLEHQKKFIKQPG
jgi:hypothetical protein